MLCAHGLAASIRETFVERSSNVDTGRKGGNEVGFSMVSYPVGQTGSQSSIPNLTPRGESCKHMLRKPSRGIAPF